uniref:Uncharacterized protein n=1 Tax=Rhizophora mucronata TaxID=61149 RepID=A0A2P2QS64_RHIMU
MKLCIEPISSHILIQSPFAITKIQSLFAITKSPEDLCGCNISCEG